MHVSLEIQRRLDAIDRELAKKSVSLAELLAMKDEIMVILSSDPTIQAATGPRIARINIRLKLAAGEPRSLEAEAAQKARFYAAFYESAKRLLDRSSHEMIGRDARAAVIADTAAPIASLPARAVPLKPTPKPLEPMKVPMHQLIIAAQHGPLRFDPVRLFKDFGREKVLAIWDALPAEKRPETAAEFREILRLGIPS